MIYEVGVTYAVCGCIKVQADNEKEAFDKVNSNIRNYCADDVDKKLYLPDSLHADNGYVEKAYHVCEDIKK